MKLIDIDKVVSDYKAKNKSLQNVTWFELTDYEVKAIPIEWIKEWYKKALSKSGFMGDEMVSVEDLLEDWEKENGN